MAIISLPTHLVPESLLPRDSGSLEIKRAAGRPKDLEVIAELEALREEREGLADGWLSD